MKRSNAGSILSILLVLSLCLCACGDSEVNLAYADGAGVAERSDIEKPADAEQGDAEQGDSSDQPPAYDPGPQTSSVLVSLEGDALAEALASGELGLSSETPFHALDVSWRGDADLTLVTDIEREVKPDFEQRGAFDALLELDQPTSSASLRADPSELTFLRISAISGTPTQGDDR